MRIVGQFFIGCCTGCFFDLVWFCQCAHFLLFMHSTLDTFNISRNEIIHHSIIMMQGIRSAHFYTKGAQSNRVKTTFVSKELFLFSSKYEWIASKLTTSIYQLVDIYFCYNPLSNMILIVMSLLEILCYKTETYNEVLITKSYSFN